MTSRSLKKQAGKPTVIFLRLYGDAQARMKKICKRFSTDHNSVGMAGTLAEMDRLERLPAEVTAEEVAAIAEVRAVGLSPAEILRAALPRLSADPTHPQA